MNFTKLLVIVSWIYFFIYVLFDLPMDMWQQRAIRSACSFVCSFSLLLFIITRIDRWKSRANN